MKQNYNALILKSVKITAGAILAILFASCLNLKYSATAGIITILSIQNTKKETIQTALARGEAFCCALLVSFLCYNFFDYTTAAFGIYLLIFTTLCLAMKWSSAIAMDSVLILSLIHILCKVAPYASSNIHSTPPYERHVPSNCGHRLQHNEAYPPALAFYKNAVHQVHFFQSCLLYTSLLII